MIVIDLDRTLLFGPRHLTNKNKKALTQILSSSSLLVIATGRDLIRTTSVIKQFAVPEANIMLVCFNGGLIYDWKKQKVLNRQHFNKKEAQQIFSIINNHKIQGWAYGVEDKGIAYVSQTKKTWILLQKYWEKKEYDLTVFPTAKPVCLNKVLIVANQKQLKIVYSKINKKIKNSLFYFSIFNPRHLQLDLNPDQTNKQHAVAWIAEKYKINNYDIFAIGDGHNDIKLLKWAGWGVAMGNASNDVKTAANAVTNSNFHSGVAVALKKYVFDD